VASLPSGWRFQTGPTATTAYSNAQIDDYHHLSRSAFRWRPPVTLSLRARFSHPAGILQGTAGFGLWNDPFMMSGSRTPALPRAVWFFYASPPSNMQLAQGVPGHGWKAAVIDAQRPLFYLLAPTAPVSVPSMRWSRAYRALWPVAQAAIGVAEAPVATDLCAWHSYRLSWEPDLVRFWVDDTLVLVTTRAPRGPLGLVIWLDNQYMVLTPQGHVRHGLLAHRYQQWLEITGLCIG
jgi:hypothetical protein